MVETRSETETPPPSTTNGSSIKSENKPKTPSNASASLLTTSNAWVNKQINSVGEAVSDNDQSDDTRNRSQQRTTRETRGNHSTIEGPTNIRAIDSKLMSESGKLWDDLDSQREQLEAQMQGDVIIIGAAGAAASSFTVGVVAWALRTGFIASGLLAQLPAWRAFDPSVLMQDFAGLTVKNKESGDEETLEELMDRQSQSITN